MIITYPQPGQLLDDTGAVLTAPVVAIASVVDKAGSAIAGNGAAVNGSGTSTPISVDYDAEAHGEAWITLAVSQSGHAVTGQNAAPYFFASKDPSNIGLLISRITAAPPTSAQIATAVRAEIDTNSTQLGLLVALSGQNSGVRNELYDSAGNLTSADLCSYDSPTHAALNDGATGLVHQFALAFTYVSGRQATQSIAQVS